MRIDFDRIVPKHRDSKTCYIASIVADSTHVQFFLEECERYGIMWSSGEFPTEFNPLDTFPDDVFFRFVLFDGRNDESGNIELTYDSYEVAQVLNLNDIPIEDLIIDDNEIWVSSEPPIPLDLNLLFREVLK